MNRFFVEPHQVREASQEMVITGEDVKHISKVLRLTEADLVEVCDGRTFEYIGKIKEINKNEVWLSIEEKREMATESPIKVTLYQGIPKATKMELIIQKTTEMGIVEVIPVITDRTVVKLNEDRDKEKKTERWQKIAQEAAKQSKRGIVPKIHNPITFKKALEDSQKNQLNIMAYELHKETGLKSVLSSVEGETIKEIGIWIGPEGGYTEEEVQLAIEQGIRPITLGPRILRTETAGFALLSMIMYDIGDLGGY